MEQRNGQMKKTAGQSTGKVVLAFVLGICVIALAAVDGFLFIKMNQSSQIGRYIGKQSDLQEDDLSDVSVENSEDSISSTMSGFVAGGTSVSEREDEGKKKNKKVSNKDYILPESNSKYYTIKDLKKLTREEVKLARNEIYARHGRKFVVDKNVKKYFEGKDWYKGTVDEVSDSELNKYEIANRDLIIKYEKKKKWN